MLFTVRYFHSPPKAIYFCLALTFFIWDRSMEFNLFIIIGISSIYQIKLEDKPRLPFRQLCTLISLVSNLMAGKIVIIQKWDRPIPIWFSKGRLHTRWAIMATNLSSWNFEVDICSGLKFLPPRSKLFFKILYLYHSRIGYTLIKGCLTISVVTVFDYNIFLINFHTILIGVSKTYTHKLES